MHTRHPPSATNNSVGIAMGDADVRIKDPNGYVLIVGQRADHQH